MNFGAILVGLAILVLASSYVASPFGNPKKGKNSRANTAEKKAGYDELKGQEQIALKKLHDLDFDFQTGKVSEEDYLPLRNHLVVETAQIMEAVKQEEAQLEAQIEAQIDARRQANTHKVKCAACGAGLLPEDRFCPVCGQAAFTACENCGKTIRSGDLYCSSCGSPVKKPAQAITLEHR